MVTYARPLTTPESYSHASGVSAQECGNALADDDLVSIPEFFGQRRSGAKILNDAFPCGNLREGIPNVVFL
jgi:hypothetical protein